MSPHTAQRLADRQTPAGLAATLMWTTTGLLFALQRLDTAQTPDTMAAVQVWVERVRGNLTTIEEQTR